MNKNKLKRYLKIHTRILDKQQPAEAFKLEKIRYTINQKYKTKPKLIKFINKNALYWAINQFSFKIDIKKNKLKTLITDYKKIKKSKYPTELKNFLINNFSSWHIITNTITKKYRFTLKPNSILKEYLIIRWKAHIYNKDKRNKDKSNNDPDKKLDKLIKKLKKNGKDNNGNDDYGPTMSKKKHPKRTGPELD